MLEAFLGMLETFSAYTQRKLGSARGTLTNADIESEIIQMAAEGPCKLAVFLLVSLLCTSQACLGNHTNEEISPERVNPEHLVLAIKGAHPSKFHGPASAQKHRWTLFREEG